MKRLTSLRVENLEDRNLLAAVGPALPDAASDVAAEHAPRVIGGRPLSAELSGDAEVPGPGDPDGTGSVEIVVNQGLGQICYDIQVENIADATAAHIHLGEADVSGGVVVNFDVANNGLSGCVDADKDLIKAIRQNPAGYYVNVHNADFPPGAVRGQLSK